ncbi:MAG: hypothetical protein U9P49_00850 [Thermodesulfobacteriota bacterium]|nr:hypothetical protein [Thermodesulfobacteriota bacterium]
MDSDTKKKVKDLLALMDNFSYDIDAKAEIEGLREEIKDLQKELGALKQKFSQFEETYLHKREEVRLIQKELKTLFNNKQ